MGTLTDLANILCVCITFSKKVTKKLLDMTISNKKVGEGWPSFKRMSKVNNPKHNARYIAQLHFLLMVRLIGVLLVLTAHAHSELLERCSQLQGPSIV